MSANLYELRYHGDRFTTTAMFTDPRNEAQDGYQPSQEDDLDAVISAQARRLRSRLFAPPRYGHYEIIKEIGCGGMGVVHVAHDTRLGRKVAIKTVRHTGNPELRARLEGEARAMARLSHPNIVTVFEFGEDETSTFIVMEYIEGITLRAWLRETRRTQAEILAVFRAAGEGLAYAHDNGMIHRDFKPTNVMFDETGRVRVVDFGLARPDPACEETQRIDGAQGPPADDTPASGTPAYMAPEQFQNTWVGPESDQFSFCIALYEGLYGMRPFAGQSVAELRSAIESRSVREPSSRTDVSATVHAAIMRGLEPNPADRFESMRALLDSLSDPPPLAEAECQATPPARGPNHTIYYLGVALVLALLTATLATLLEPTPQTNVVRVVACRAKIVKFELGVEFATVKVINLKSGEMLRTQVTNDNIVIFECPASRPIEVMVIAEYTDGTRSTWSVTVHPLADTTLTRANAIRQDEVEHTSTPTSVSSTPPPTEPPLIVDPSDSVAEGVADTSEASEPRTMKPKSTHAAPETTSATVDEEPSEPGTTTGEVDTAHTDDAAALPDVRIQCDRRTLGADDRLVPSWCK